MRFSRASGILLHITSLPGPHGIGDLGSEAFRFVDFLSESGQSIWQLLPLTPPARGESPYSSNSAFAGNPLLISLSRLVEKKLLPDASLPINGGLGTDPHHADFASVQAFKMPLLRQAFEHFQTTAGDAHRQQFERFCRAQAGWLLDFARFTALVEDFNEPDWTRWDDRLVKRDPAALADSDRRLSDAIERAKYLQFVFFTQYAELKTYARENGVRLFGDMPIFVAHESADVWANQAVFSLDDAGRPTVVAGVPPDYFSETGQLWGNPLYRWNHLAATNYAWWTDRFRAAFDCFDLLRIDHFRGFEAYWEVPADAPTAVAGQWRPGPGAAPFEAAQKALGELAIVAEDLGMITDKVHQLRDQLGFPGMRVLQFGYDKTDDDFHRPSAYPKHSVAYTGTHDNDTILGWYRTRHAEHREVELLQSLVAEVDLQPHWTMIKAVLNSPADTAIVPLQDILGLGSEARMNTPGLADGNWAWRFTPKQLTPELARHLRTVTQAANR